MSLKRKRNELSLSQKREVVELLDRKYTQKQVATRFDVDPSVISRMSKKKEVIRELFESNHTNNGSKRQKKSKAADVQSGLYQWFEYSRSMDMPINGPMLMNKAKTLADELGVPDFGPSTGWMSRWKRRNNIVYNQSTKSLDIVEKPKILTSHEASNDTIIFKQQNSISCDESNNSFTDEHQISSSAEDTKHSIQLIQFNDATSHDDINATSTVERQNYSSNHIDATDSPTTEPHSCADNHDDITDRVNTVEQQSAPISQAEIDSLITEIHNNDDLSDEDTNVNATIVTNSIPVVEKMTFRRAQRFLLQLGALMVENDISDFSAIYELQDVVNKYAKLEPKTNN